MPQRSNVCSRGAAMQAALAAVCHTVGLTIDGIQQPRRESWAKGPKASLAGSLLHPRPLVSSPAPRTLNGVTRSPESAMIPLPASLSTPTWPSRGTRSACMTCASARSSRSVPAGHQHLASRRPQECQLSPTVDGHSVSQLCHQAYACLASYSEARRAIIEAVAPSQLEMCRSESMER